MPSSWAHPNFVVQHNYGTTRTKSTIMKFTPKIVKNRPVVTGHVKDCLFFRFVLNFCGVSEQNSRLEREGGVPAQWRMPWSFRIIHVLSFQKTIGGLRLIYISLSGLND